MESLAPQLATTPIVEVHRFDVPDSFLAERKAAILVKFKSKKSPGLDLIRTELLQLAPSLIAEAALALWRAAGRTGSVPPLIRSEFLLLYTNKKGSIRVN